MNIVLNGASGSGKGTLARFLAADYGLQHVSTGDIFRENIAKKTELGRKIESFVSQGLWVPDDITIAALLDRIKQSDCRNGIILDGFPRTLAQAKALDLAIVIDYVLAIEVTDEVVIQRLGGRFICKDCNEIHNKRWDKTEKCKVCGGELFQREDDKEETILRRLQNFRANNDEILNYYRERGKLLLVKDKIENSPEMTYKLF
ncbi:MAG: nucleoside monophosphate kinase, partial [Christensenellaceae bacterium]|nr:nucleoside monophosphate kinase [Christensenellaceae bacterium]